MSTFENDDEIKVVIRTGTSTNPPIPRTRESEYYIEFILEIDYGYETNDNKEVYTELSCKSCEKEEAGNKCVICLNNFNIGDNISTLKCKHTFHYDCLFDWIKLKPECPLCRTKM